MRAVCDLFMMTWAGYGPFPLFKLPVQSRQCELMGIGFREVGPWNVWRGVLVKLFLRNQGDFFMFRPGVKNKPLFSSHAILTSYYTTYVHFKQYLKQWTPATKNYGLGPNMGWASMLAMQELGYFQLPGFVYRSPHHGVMNYHACSYATPVKQVDYLGKEDIFTRKDWNRFVDNMWVK